MKKLIRSLVPSLSGIAIGIILISFFVREAAGSDIHGYRVARKVQSHLTDRHRAAMIAAGRAVKEWKDPEDTVTPDQLIALREIDAMMQVAGRRMIGDLEMRYLGPTLESLGTITFHVRTQWDTVNSILARWTTYGDAKERFRGRIMEIHLRSLPITPYEKTALRCADSLEHADLPAVMKAIAHNDATRDQSSWASRFIENNKLPISVRASVERSERESAQLEAQWKRDIDRIMGKSGGKKR